MSAPDISLSSNVRPLAVREHRSIGAVLIDAGRLSVDDAEAILRLQSEKKLRFGEAAMRLGLLTQADIDYALSCQFDYPYLLPGQSPVSEEVVAAYAPRLPQMEAMRGLRTQLMLRWFDGSPASKAVAILSAERKEGRSFIAANLAAVFAQLGERTLLVDADLRHPRQHQLFGLEPQTAGLSSLLAGRAGLESVRAIPWLPNLSLLPAGTVPPNPSELLARPVLTELLAELGQRYDVVLLDCSACAEASDAQVVAVRAGAAIIVARKNAARSWRVQGLSAQVTDARATIVGAVLNSF